MKNVFLSLCLALMLSPAFGQFGIKLNPQLGVHSARLIGSVQDITTQSNLGWQIGINALIGGRLYFAPGVYFVGTGSVVELADEQKIKFSGLQGVAQVGYRLIKSDNIIGLRIKGGPSLLKANQPGENIFDISKDDISSSLLGARVGVGIDVLFITFDLDYDYGLSKIYDYQDWDFRNGMLLLNAGVRF